MRQISKIEEKDFTQFTRLINNAYPARPFLSQDEEDHFTDRLITIQKEDKHVNYYGYYDEQTLNGCMRLHDYQMNMLGSEISVGGIGLVGVDLLHKKEKIAKEMVTYFLNHYRQKGALIALLYPFRPDFYKKMGFGYGPKMDRYQIKPSSFPSTSGKNNLCYLTERDKSELHSCYERFEKNQHGMIKKTPFELDRLFMDRQARIIGFKKNENLEGYMVFRFEKAHENNMVMNNLIIDEWIYLNKEALGEFLTFLHTQDDQVHRIVLNTLDPSFYYLLQDPRNETNNVIPHVYHEMHTSGVGLMYKVLDISGPF